MTKQGARSVLAQRTARAIAAACAAASATVAACVLLGWVVDAPALRLGFGAIAMKPNTAIAMLACAAALAAALRDGRGAAAARVVGGVAVAASASVVGLQWAADANLGVDQLIVVDRGGALGALPAGRMAPTTTLAFVALGVALAALDARRVAVWTTAAIVAGSLGLLAAVDVLYVQEAQTAVASYRQMAFTTAACFVLLALGVVFARAERGVVAAVFADDAGGATARSVLPAAVALPVGLSWLRLEAERAGVFDRDFGVALMATTMAVLFSLLVVRVAAQVSGADRDARRAAAFAAAADRDQRETAAFLDALVENLPAMLFVKDANRLAFQRLNKAGEELLGTPRAAMLGKTDDDFFPPEQAAFSRAKDRQTLQERAVVDVAEERVDTPAGPRWLHTKKVPILNADGAPAYLLGISIDVTARREAEDALRRAQSELLAANAELESFSYSVSHDLRAPLRAVNGFARALLEDHAPKLDDEARDWLNRICAAAERMSHLIDDLLMLSRVTRAEVRREAVDVTRAAREIADELRRDEPGRVIEVRVADGMVAHADERLLRIVLQNLLGNAFKFTRGRTSALIEVGLDDAGRFFVRDDGAGFDPAYADKLFGAFQRLHATTEFPGTGIGLATVLRVVRRHGGEASARGAVGQGATFTFTLGTGGDTA